MQPLLVLLALLACWATAEAATTATAAVCEERGFDSASLLCGVCSKLRAVGGASLEQECLECCTSKYSSATLVLPNMVLAQSSAFQDFVSTRKPKFSARQVFVDVTPPQQYGEEDKQLVARLILQPAKKSEEEPEILRVTKWTANDLEDFLAQYFPMVK